MHRILVVDDEVQVRTMLRRVLNSEGFEVVEASDGREALRVQSAEPADVVITDIFMPTQDGLETIMKLRRQHPAAKIIAISGGGRMQADHISTLQQARLLGAARVFSKPVSNNTLISAIREVLDEEVAGSQRPGSRTDSP